MLSRLASLSEKRLGVQVRATDTLVAGVAFVLFGAGFLWPNYLLFREDLIVAALVIAAFHGVFYPFRLLARSLWIAGTPLVIFALPWHGARMRLRLDLGVAPESIESESFVFSLFSSLAWGLLYLLGWRLSCPHQETRTVSLKELFAFVGLFGVLLVLCRDAFMVIDYGRALSFAPMIWRYHFDTPSLWANYAIVFLGLQLRCPVSVFICAGICCVLCVYEYYDDKFTYERAWAVSIEIIGQPRTLLQVTRDFIASTWLSIVIVVWCRMCGFRIQWRSPFGLRERTFTD